jgi:hypothetical protein
VKSGLLSPPRQFEDEAICYEIHLLRKLYNDHLIRCNTIDHHCDPSKAQKLYRHSQFCGRPLKAQHKLDLSHKQTPSSCSGQPTSITPRNTVRSVKFPNPQPSNLPYRLRDQIDSSIRCGYTVRKIASASPSLTSLISPKGYKHAQ